MGIIYPININKNENIASQIIGAAASGLGLGLAITVSIDILLVGGGSAYLALASTGAIGALGLSAAAYTVATAGIGLIVAGAVAGIYVLVKSDWKFEDANEKAVEQVLSLMKNGRSDMIN